MKRPLTKRQFEYLEYIKGYFDEHGRVPRLAQIMQHFGVALSTSHNMLMRLGDKGYLKNKYPIGYILVWDGKVGNNEKKNIR